MIPPGCHWFVAPFVSRRRPFVRQPRRKQKLAGMESLESRFALAAGAGGVNRTALTTGADVIAPAVLSITAPPSKTYAAGSTLAFKVNFTERVVVTGSPTLPLKIGNSVRHAVWNGASASGRSLVFSMTIQPGDRAPSGVAIAGPIGGLTAVPPIRDMAGNPLIPTATGVFPRVKVDAIGPSIIRFGAATVTSRRVSLSVTFSEPVAVRGRPLVWFTLAGAPRPLAYQSGSGKNVLTFSYNPVKGEVPTATNVRLPPPAIAFNRGTIADLFGNAAVSVSTPTDVRLSSVHVFENQPVGTMVAALSTADSDGTRDRYTYKLVAGLGSTDNTNFQIVNNQLRTAASFDFETKTTYSIRVRSTDSGGLAAEQIFTITVADMDDHPVVPSLLRDVKDLGGTGLALEPGGWSSSPDAFTRVGTTTYFVADGNRISQTGSLFGGPPAWIASSAGRELWKTDGTEAGTALVRDIRPGAESSNISSLVNLAGTLLFVAAESPNGYEIWRSDGTEGGTVPVTNADFSERRKPQQLFVIGGTAYFTTENASDFSCELWKTDGTPEGTVLVKNVWPGSLQSWVGNLIDVDGALHFTAYDPTYDEGRTKTIWKSDGTPEGTVRVAVFPKGAEGGTLVAAGGRIYTNPFVSEYDSQLWTLDDGSTELRLIRDIRAGWQRSTVESLTAVGGVVYFSADDGITGKELWRSDGTAEGTRRVRDIQVVAYDKLTWQPPQAALPSASASEPALPSPKSSQPGPDVTASTIVVPPFNPYASIGSEPGDFVVFGESLFFTAFDDVHGRQVWRTDGTDTGTVRIGGLPPAATRTSAAWFTEIGGHLYFVNANALWRTDGTFAGTRKIDGAVPDVGSLSWTGLDGRRYVSERTRPLARLGSTLIFSGFVAETGAEPWKVSPASI